MYLAHSKDHCSLTTHSLVTHSFLPFTILARNSINELCITLIADYLNGKIGKDDAIGHILEVLRELDMYKRVTPVQIQTPISAYIRMLDQAKSA